MAAKLFTRLADALKAPEKVRRLQLIGRSAPTALPDFAIFPQLEELSLLG